MGVEWHQGSHRMNERQRMGTQNCYTRSRNGVQSNIERVLRSDLSPARSLPVVVAASQNKYTVLESTSFHQSFF